MDLLKKIWTRLDLCWTLLERTGKIRLAKDVAPNPHPGDVYLVSYPKSGNTWMRYLLAYAIWPELNNIDLTEMASFVPSVNIPHDIKQMLKKGIPCNRRPFRIIKSHFRYHPIAKKVIFIVRDGRDAMVSYWHFSNQRDGTNIPFSDFLCKPQPYGPWKDYVLEWINAPVEKLVLRYEDMLVNAGECLGKVLDFVGVEVEQNQLNQAVEKASFRSLKKLEREKGLNLGQLEKVNFMRKGTVGSWRETFGDGDLALFNQYHGGSIPELGYTW